MDREKLTDLTSALCDTVVCADETVSTNTDARRLTAELPSADVILCTAKRQTGGRGRQGKSFLSPDGGLYMTLAMRTGLPLTSVVGVTSSAAVAVTNALARQSIRCGIKWVNDIYLNDKKLAGILTESINDGSRSDHVLIGIGVNIASFPFPEEINAISLEEVGYSVSPEQLCADIVRELLTIREHCFDFSICAEAYRARSIVLGREVTYIRNGSSTHGTAVAIDECGRLLVQVGDELHTLDSGEITLRRSETASRHRRT